MRHPLRNGRDSKRRDSECQGLRRLTNRTRFHTFNRTYWVMQGMHAVLRHILRVIFAVAVIAVSGCGASPLYVQTSGTAGPLQWEAVDLASGVEIREGQEVDTYEFTLILRETRGVGLTFTNVSSTLYGGGFSFELEFGRVGQRLDLVTLGIGGFLDVRFQFALFAENFLLLQLDLLLLGDDFHLHFLGLYQLAGLVFLQIVGEVGFGFLLVHRGLITGDVGLIIA